MEREREREREREKRERGGVTKRGGKGYNNRRRKISKKKD